MGAADREIVGVEQSLAEMIPGEMLYHALAAGLSVAHEAVAIGMSLAEGMHESVDIVGRMIQPFSPSITTSPDSRVAIWARPQAAAS